MNDRQDDHWVYYMAQIGHELRTPLNIIKGFGDLLHSETPGPLNDQQKLYMEKILKGADDLTIIVNDILEWARISSGQLQLDREDLSLRTLLLELSDFFRHSFDKAQLTAHYDLQEVDLVSADRQRIKQALINIFGNALKYVPAGQEVFISCQQRDQSVEIVVRDTGPGLSQDDMARIMEPFRRGSQSVKTEQGTGLGLWITHAIVEAHGGSLMMTNADEGGAVFILSLPLGSA